MEKKVSKFDDEFIKKYDEESNKGYIPDLDVERNTNLRTEAKNDFE